MTLDKGKVESSVGHAQKTPLKGLRFEGPEEAQAYLDRWEERWADTRIHGTTKRQVAAMFAEEKPALLPLPLGTVSLLPIWRENGTSGRLCRSRSRLLQCSARLDWPSGASIVGRQVSALARSEKRATVPRTLAGERGRHRIKEEDRPQQTPIGVVKLLARTASAGEHIGQFCELMHAQQGELAVRRMQGILSFAKSYGIARVDDACAAALELEAIDYRFVRRYLERNTQPPLSLRQVDPLIRQLNLYRDFIEDRTKEKPNS
jgi:hypothetical protein